MGGRGPLIGTDYCVRESQIYLSQSGDLGLPRPPTASQIRPHKHTASQIRPHKHTASHILSCDLSEPIRGEHGLPRESDLRGRIRPHRTGQGNAFSREISQTGPRIVLPCPESDQTPTASQIGLTDQTLKSVRPICEADL